MHVFAGLYYTEAQFIFEIGSSLDTNFRIGLNKECCTERANTLILVPLLFPLLFLLSSRKRYLGFLNMISLVVLYTFL
jgi:hypothetical protein